MFNFRVATILLVAELWFCNSKVKCNVNFTECYNTTTEMHCFSKIVNGAFNFTEAQKRCSAIGATLPVIKDDEVQTLLETFISYLNNSAGIEDSISYFWTNANLIIESNWHWLNSSVISDPGVSITTGSFFENHVASLALQNSSQQEVVLTANNPGENMSYICEFSGSDCKSQNGNVLQYSDKCYVAFEEDTTWYDARNRCLNKRGDLASFGDLKNTGINFTQWLDLSSAKQYWVGVRLLRWMWNKSDNMTEVRYTSWRNRSPVPPYSSDTCVIVYANSGIAAEINGWGTTDCNQKQSVGVICHKVTALPKDEGSATTLKDSTTASSVIPLAVGIGLGVGIPVVIAIIVIIVVCVKRKRKPHQNGDTLKKNTDDSVLNDAQTDSMETEKDDNAATGGVYWNVAKNDSASATKDVGKVIESSASNTNNGDGILYSAVQFVEEQYEDDLP